MRSTLIIISSLIVFSSCTMPWSKPVTPTQVEYSTTQSDSPAAKYCMANKGLVSVEKNPSNPTMDLIYCTIGGEKIDAWKYMDMGTTTQTGAMMGSGMPI